MVAPLAHHVAVTAMVPTVIVAAVVVTIADLLSVIAAIALIVVVRIRQRRGCAEQRERERPDE